MGEEWNGRREKEVELAPKPRDVATLFGMSDMLFANSIDMILANLIPSGDQAL